MTAVAQSGRYPERLSVEEVITSPCRPQTASAHGLRVRVRGGRGKHFGLVEEEETSEGSVIIAAQSDYYLDNN